MLMDERACDCGFTAEELAFDEQMVVSERSHSLACLVYG